MLHPRRISLHCSPYRSARSCAQPLRVMGGPRSSQAAGDKDGRSSPRRAKNTKTKDNRRAGRFNCDTGRAPKLGGQQQRGRAQVCFDALPFPQDPLVAIVGGGLSGLVCSIELAKQGVRSLVFDTGEHGVGGRLGTRAEHDGSLPAAPPGVPGLAFDHAAQYFTASDPHFQDMVDEWEADGVVRPWTGPVGELRWGGFIPLRDPQPRYIASQGMRSLAAYLAAKATRTLSQQQGESGGSTRGSAADLKVLVDVRRPQWVSDMVPVEKECQWKLVGQGREQGMFDAVVVAHNGKCANRLVAPAGVPQVYNQLRQLKLAPNWVLMVAFASPLPLGQPAFEGAFIQESAVLSWAANNTAKLRTAGEGASEGLECWTLISTQEYGRRNKVPQENVPAEVRERVAGEMLAEFARCLGLPAHSALPPLVYSRVQLWGAALPLNSPGVPCIWDPAGRVGVCGDWVHSGGSMQAAALSGRALAQRIAAMRGASSAQASQLASGLVEPLNPVGGTAIGQFPAVPGGVEQGSKVLAEGQRASRQPVRSC